MHYDHHNQRNILITGGAGYIGSHIAWLMAHSNYNIIVLDNLVYGQTFNFQWATLIKGDYGNAQLLEEIFTTYSIDTVIHCAASIEVGESVKNPLKFYENNVAKTITLLQTMSLYKISKIIFSSSCAVYGIPQGVPIPEDHPKLPISPYGHTKLMIETILQDTFNAYGISYVVLRFFNAAGALHSEGLYEQHKPETHLIPLLLQAAIGHKPFYIFGSCRPTLDGTCIRDFVHVLDIAKAHMQAIEYLNNGNRPDIFNLGTGEGFSIKEIVHATENICQCAIDIEYKEDRPGDPSVLIADAQKAKTILTWIPIYSDLETIIKSAYADGLHIDVLNGTRGLDVKGPEIHNY